MSSLPERQGPLVGLGMASLVLGVVALLLAFLPVLGIPISICGGVFGVAGFVAALVSPRTSLRWSVGGLAACCLALGVNVAVVYAPSGYLPGRNVPKPWQPVPDRPYVPPPAPALRGQP